MSRAASHFFDLTGRTALVTGGGRGIGLAISQGLADAGASVLINGRDEVVLEQAVSHICKEGGDAAALAFDIADPDQVEAAFHGLNSLDILINNVGVRNRGPIDAFTLDDFRAL